VAGRVRGDLVHDLCDYRDDARQVEAGVGGYNVEADAVSAPLYQLKAEFFKTLGHPVRIRVLELLSEREHAVSELLTAIEIEPANLSQQLAVLRRAGLVTTRK
jgi:ArsR family transcriptional regulator